MLNLQADEDLLVQTFSILLDQPNDFSTQNCKENPQNTKIVETLIHKLKQVQKTFNLYLDDQDTFIKKVISDSRILRTNFDTNSPFFDHTTDFFKRMKEIHLDFYKTLEKNLEEYTQAFCPERTDTKNRLLYSIYKNWPNLLAQLLEKKTLAKGVVVSYFGDEYAQMKCEILNHFLGYKFHFLPFSGQDLNRESIAYLSRYDLIITDFNFDHHPNQLVINIDHLPTAEDAFQIRKRYLKWVKEESEES